MSLQRSDPVRVSAVPGVVGARRVPEYFEGAPEKAKAPLHSLEEVMPFLYFLAVLWLMSSAPKSSQYRCQPRSKPKE